MSKKLDEIQVLAWKIQFYNLFSYGEEMFEKCINARFLNKDPSKNYSPELQKIFRDTLGEFIEEYPNCNLQEILDNQIDILGEELNQCDLISG
ncbi:MAG: hypothetical protein AAF673_04790 [Pseudomonadota bacterium]